MTSALLPDWFVILETPGGSRWIYDLPDAMSTLARPTPPQVHSDGGAVEVVADKSGPSYQRTHRIVADHPLRVVTWQTKGRDQVIAYSLRDPATRSEAFPEILTVDEWNTRCVRDDCDSCSWCDVRYRLYAPVTEATPGETRSYDFSGYVQLPGNGLDSHPQFPWEVGPQGRVLPAHLHHLLPGVLGGVWDAVAQAVGALPHVLNEGGFGQQVYTSGDEIRLHVRLPLDKPRERWVDKVGPTRRHKVKAVKVTDTHVDKLIELRPPRGIRAQTKAEAVRELTRLIAACVDQVNAAAVVWCTACNGHGYTIPDPERTS